MIFHIMAGSYPIDRVSAWCKDTETLVVDTRKRGDAHGALGWDRDLLYDVIPTLIVAKGLMDGEIHPEVMEEVIRPADGNVNRHVLLIVGRMAVPSIVSWGDHNDLEMMPWRLSNRRYMGEKDKLMPLKKAKEYLREKGVVLSDHGFHYYLYVNRSLSRRGVKVNYGEANRWFWTIEALDDFIEEYRMRGKQMVD